MITRLILKLCMYMFFGIVIMAIIGTVLGGILVLLHLFN